MSNIKQIDIAFIFCFVVPSIANDINVNITLIFRLIFFYKYIHIIQIKKENPITFIYDRISFIYKPNCFNTSLDISLIHLEYVEVIL